MVKNESIIALEADPNDDEDFAASEEAVQAALADRRARRGGRPKGTTTSNKSQVTIRLDNDVLAKLRASGPGWQGRVNEAVRKAVGL